MEPEGVNRHRFETLAAVDALRAAMPSVRARRGADEVREKAPGDLVTATDVEAQGIIEQRLRHYTPEIGFIGEEGEPADHSGASFGPSATMASVTRRYWLVDPICGTANYAAGMQLYAMNIALVEAGQVTCAAVADGSHDEILVAERGRGAWRLAPQGSAPIHADATSRLLSLDPHSRASGALAHFGLDFAHRALDDQRWDIRVLSTTLALAYIATGRLAGAVYAQLGSPVHFAAGCLLAEEAGAIVTNERGQPWTLDEQIYVIAADAALHADLLTLITAILESRRR